MDCTVNVMREDFSESLHRIHVAAVDISGKLIAGFGQPQKITSWRSSAKPFQVLPFILHKGIEKYKITTAELAIMAASHNGEQVHITQIQNILHKLGIAEEELACGTAVPLNARIAHEMELNGQKFRAIHNNCSGKHSCMLGLAKLIGASVIGYFEINHPVQRLMLEVVAEATGLDKKAIGTGIDGCGVPVFFLPLHSMGWAYSRLAQPQKGQWGERTDHVRVLQEAVINNPYNISGIGSFDTMLMTITNGRIIAKGGAESVFCIASATDGIGLAFKVEDGSKRAIASAGIALLKKLGLITKKEHSELIKNFSPVIKNLRGDAVGQIEVLL